MHFSNKRPGCDEITHVVVEARKRYSVISTYGTMAAAESISVFIACVYDFCKQLCAFEGFAYTSLPIA